MEWDLFVSNAKNGTFLFQRDFIEYHKDRFIDHSLMIFKKDKLIALFPANKTGNTLYSHQGLTFGSLILPNKSSYVDLTSIVKELKMYCEKQDLNEINIKLSPSFYHQYPSNELAHILYKENAELYRRDMVLAIDYANELLIHKTKIKHYKKGLKLGLLVKEDEQLENFWNGVLIPLLKLKHNSNPVHSLNEIKYLKEKFPENIKQFNAIYEDEIVAGITIFENEKIVKSQYAATTEKGEKYRALDFLFISLINYYKKEGKQFFSMGTVSDSSDLGFKKGLLKQKEEFGNHIYLQDFFKLKI